MRSIFLAGLATLAAAGPGLRAQPPSPACVREAKPVTRTVYAVKDEAYCLPRCDLLSWLLGRCGCGEPRVRHRLVVKQVPAGSTTTCVPDRGPAK